MRLKLITIVLLVVGLFYYGCVEEPAIPTYNRPNSAVRIVNLAANLETVSVLLIPLVPDVPDIVDDPATTKGPFSLASGSATDYFVTPSGGYRLAVLAANGDTLYSQNISVTSFENLTVMLVGYYSANKDENTFGNLIFSEGEIYTKLPPNADSISMYFVHGAPASPTSDTRPLNVRGSYKPAGAVDFVYVDSNYTARFDKADFVSGDIEEIDNFPKGDYKLTFLSGTQIIAVDSGYYDGNLRYNLFIYGTPENMKLFKNVIPPPPVRVKN